MPTTTAKTRLDRGVGEPVEGFAAVADLKTAFDDLEDAWQGDDAVVRAVADQALAAAQSVEGDTTRIVVTSYGAAGNGTTDDTAAIQAALNAVPATGAQVVFPRGSYLVSAPLVVKSHTHIEGCELATRYHGYADTPPASVCNLRVANSFSGGQVLQFNAGVSACSVVGLTILGRGVGTVHGILLGYAGTGTECNYKFRDVNIISMGGDGIRGGVWASRWESIYVGGCHGIGINATYRFSDTRFIDCYVNGNASGGLSLNGSSKSGLCQFIACRFERSGWDPGNPTSPVDTDAPGIWIGNAENIQFIGCETDANAGHGLAIVPTATANVAFLRFVGCSFNRDGFGTMAGSSAGEFAGVLVLGYGSGVEAQYVQFANCEVKKARASDVSNDPDYLHPKYGLWAQNTSHLEWIGGNVDGDVADLYAGGGTWEAGGNYRPQLYLPTQHVTTIAQGSTSERPTLGINGSLFYDTSIDKLIVYNGSAWLDAAGGSL